MDNWINNWMFLFQFIGLVIFNWNNWKVEQMKWFYLCKKILPFTSRNCNESMYAQGNSPIIYYNFGKYTMDGMHDIGIENEFSL